MKKFVIVSFALLCVASILFGATHSGDAATMTVYQNTFDIPAANSGRVGILHNFSMPQFNPALGTLQSVDVTVSGGAVNYSGSNSISVYVALVVSKLSVATAGLTTGELTRNFSAVGEVNTLSGTLAAAQNTRVNNDALWGFPMLTPYIGTSTVGGMVGLYEQVGYQSGNSFYWFDTQSFGQYGGSVTIDYNYTPAPQVPEPATMFLLGSGLIGLAGYGKKKFFKK